VKVGRVPWIWICHVVLGGLLTLIVAHPALGAENHLDLKPPLIRPGGTITLQSAVALEAGKKLFLRLSHIGTTSDVLSIIDLPLDAAATARGISRVTLPSTMVQGNYTGDVVDEQGHTVATGGKLRVLASQPPSIAKVVPHATYAVDKTYGFELVGDNFSQDPKDNIVKVNDVAVKFEHYVLEPTSESGSRTAKDCAGQFPCLISNRRNIRIYGFVLPPHVSRPLMVTVQVDGRVSDPKTVLLAWGDRSTPAIIAFACLGLLAGLVYFVARKKAAQYTVDDRSYTTLAYVFIEPETNTFSLSRLQLILWTAAAVVAYVYLAASQFLVQWSWALPKVPDGLPALLGLSVGTTALAVGATSARGSKGAGPLHPGVGDFITSGGVFAPERLQFFIWTILGVVGFVSATLAQDPATVTDLPKIPDNFLPLMGVSSLGYLAGKVVRKPGPVVKQLIPPPPYVGGPVSFRILGESLSPRAQVRLNGTFVSADHVTVPATEPQDAEFVKELVVTVPTVNAAPPGVLPVKIINADGQSAEN
jgi:hypothetical protein